MTAALFTWMVYPAALPLDGRPQLLGELEAANIVAAREKAAEQWPGLALLVQSAASHRVRSVVAPVPAPVERTNRGRKRGRKGRYHQQLDAFTAAKRAAHEAKTRRAEAMTTTTGEA